MLEKRAVLSALVVVAVLVMAGGCSERPEPNAKEPASKQPEPAKPEEPAEQSLPEPDREAVLRSPLVRLIEKCSPLAVDLQIIRREDNGEYVAIWGGGTIIHEAGYVLTCNHVVAGTGDFKAGLDDGTMLPFRVAGTMYDSDLAVLKLDADKPLPAAVLGRSDQVALGQTVVVFGNPSGQFHTVTNGIISGLDRGEWRMFQTNAAINPGNSGGPAFNALGELMGVVQIKKPELENAGYMIPVDRVRQAFAAEFLNEQKTGLHLGMDVDVYGPAVVKQVAAGSPAEEAGVKAGDVITKAGGLRVSDGVHYCIALFDLKPGDELPLEVGRGGETVALTVRAAEAPLLEPVAAEGLVPGVFCSAYFGEWQELPDFDELEPVSWNVVPTVGLHVRGERKDHFGLKLTGYVEVKKDGLYTFYTSSDDGSKLWIGDRLVVDNDGLHPDLERSGFVRLKAGMHPITVTFFELEGGEALKALYEGPDLEKQEIPASALFTEKSE